MKHNAPPSTIIFVEKLWNGSHNIKLQSSDPSAFRLAISMLKSFVNAYYRAYHPEMKVWNVAGAANESFFRWLSYVRVHCHAQVEWLSGAEAENETRGKWSPPREEAQLDPYAVLHLRESAPEVVIRAAYRALALICHPDRGGDAEEMRRINLAYETLERRLKAA